MEELEHVDVVLHLHQRHGEVQCVRDDPFQHVRRQRVAEHPLGRPERRCPETVAPPAAGPARAGSTRAGT